MCVSVKQRKITKQSKAKKLHHLYTLWIFFSIFLFNFLSIQTNLPPFPSPPSPSPSQSQPSFRCLFLLHKPYHVSAYGFFYVSLKTENPPSPLEQPISLNSPNSSISLHRIFPPSLLSILNSFML